MAPRTLRAYSGSYTISDAHGPRDGVVHVEAYSFTMAWNHATMNVLREQKLDPEAVVEFTLTLAND